MNAPQDMWSRRRAAVQAEAEAEARATADAAKAQEQSVLAEKSDSEILAELNLQDPDEMQSGDDFAAFMKAAVPEHLRRRALRRLWLSDPVLANVDGLIDYGDDFTDSATVIGSLKTSYQVGRGMLKHIEELEAAGEHDVADATDAAAPDTDDSDGEAVLADADLAETIETDATDDQPTQPSVQEDTVEVAVKSRMRFEFAG